MSSLSTPNFKSERSGKQLNNERSPAWTPAANGVAVQNLVNRPRDNLSAPGSELTSDATSTSCAPNGPAPSSSTHPFNISKHNTTPLTTTRALTYYTTLSHFSSSLSHHGEYPTEPRTSDTRSSQNPISRLSVSGCSSAKPKTEHS